MFPFLVSRKMKTSIYAPKFLVIALCMTVSMFAFSGGCEKKSTHDTATNAMVIQTLEGSAVTAPLKVHPGNDRIMAFDMLYEADAFLKDYFKEGDLVLLKGSGLLDHLHRIVLSQTDDIACWRENCKLLQFCDVCKHRLTPCMPADEVQVG